MKKRLVALAVGIGFSASLFATGYAAPAGGSEGPKLKQGIKNARKVALAKRDRDLKMREIKKQAQAKRKEAQGKK